MGRLMRAHDWSATPLGPVEGWPQSLKTAMRIVPVRKLGNTLLDFSRIEAVRAQACCEPVDLAALTADLANDFRSVRRDARGRKRGAGAVPWEAATGCGGWDGVRRPGLCQAHARQLDYIQVSES